MFFIFFFLPGNVVEERSGISQVNNTLFDVCSGPYGGAIFVNSNVPVVVGFCVFRNCTSTMTGSVGKRGDCDGGALFCYSYTAKVNRVCFLSSYGIAGGWLYIQTRGIGSVDIESTACISDKPRLQSWVESCVYNSKFENVSNTAGCINTIHYQYDSGTSSLNMYCNYVGNTAESVLYPGCNDYNFNYNNIINNTFSSGLVKLDTGTIALWYCFISNSGNKLRTIIHHGSVTLYECYSDDFGGCTKIGSKTPYTIVPQPYYCINPSSLFTKDDVLSSMFIRLVMMGMLALL